LRRVRDHVHGRSRSVRDCHQRGSSDLVERWF
jgi:hypothetical protein